MGPASRDHPDLAQAAPSQRQRYLSAGEVADMFRVSPKTVTSWAKAGKLPYVRTLGGGHRRYPEQEVRALAALAKRPADQQRADQQPGGG